MLAFILRRLAQAALVMLAVGLIAFSLFRFVGDPVLFMLGQDATPEDRVRITLAGVGGASSLMHATPGISRTIRSINSTDMKMIRLLRRVSTPATPSVNRMAATER